MAKETTAKPSRKRTSSRKRRPASAFDVLRLVTADFGDPQVQATFPEAIEALVKAKKLARAFVAQMKAKAIASPDERYVRPVFAIKNGAYYFGDLYDVAVIPFQSKDPKDLAYVFSFSPLAGITAAEAARVFLYDEDELLVMLTSFAVAMAEQAKTGRTEAIAAHLSYLLVHLIAHLEVGVNVNGFVDLPRET
jgi:stage V sporulation protein SpoVS